MKKYAYIFLAVLLAVLIITPSYAEGEEKGTLVVTGIGTLNLSPDTAEIYMGIQTENESAEKALEENSEKMNEVISKLRALGVEIETTQFSIYPVYSYTGKEPKLKGYRVLHMIKVTTDVEDAGRVIDLAVASGVNNVQSIRFTISNLKEKKEEALKLAVRDAGEKAKIISEAVGVSILGVKEISSTSSSYPIYRHEIAYAAIGDSATPVTPGEVQISATVTVVYWIA